jgi:dCMP deaminase
MSFSKRPSWDEYFLGMAVAASARGDCIRRKVGAVLVDANNYIIGSGYNGSFPGGPSCLKGECPRCLDDTIPSGEQYENCIEYHAEDNCLRNSRFNRADPPFRMYVTYTPCYMCKELLFFWSIDTVIWPTGSLTLIPRL